jgi:hypothetical protein
VISLQVINSKKYLAYFLTKSSNYGQNTTLKLIRNKKIDLYRNKYIKKKKMGSGKTSYYFKNELIKKWNKSISSLLYSHIIDDLKINYLFSDIKGKGIFKALQFHDFKKKKRLYIKFDIKTYFEWTNSKKFRTYLNNNFNFPKDVSEVIYKMSTISQDENRIIPRGLSQSSLVSFISNLSFFEKINKLTLNLNGKMTVFVDDILCSFEILEGTDEVVFANEFISKVKETALKEKLKLNDKKISFASSEVGIEIFNFWLMNGIVHFKKRHRKMMRSKNKNKGFLKQIARYNTM